MAPARTPMCIRNFQQCRAPLPGYETPTSGRATGAHMVLEVVGGGSSAVAASSHAGCARFRGTDPLITGLTRRNLAKVIGFADTSGAIPQARWMRAMTFERLVRNEAFAGQVATRTVGALNLARPEEVITVDAHMNVNTTAQLLTNAHTRAVTDGTVTLLFQLAVPFIGFEDTRATDVKPDFAVIAPATDDGGSWLVMGDAKDYERVRSRIDDARMLKGFLQVAVGAESARAWSQLPTDMTVHRFGVLAVPRNAFLQPEPIVEDLHDYGEEVKLRIEERRREAEASGYTSDQDVTSLVEHLEATFDPATCTTCTLFSFCRDELRHSTNVGDLLIELGVGRDMRQHALGLVDGISEIGPVPASTAANIEATLTGTAQPTGQRRVDPAGLPGTVNVVIAKSDAAALGLHGIGLQRVSADGRGEWEYTVFEDPQSSETRRLVMRRLGNSLTRAMRDQRKNATADVPDPVHLIVPDQATADVLVSIADNLAGIELSRLRWQHDKDQGRPALTYDGEPATVLRPSTRWSAQPSRSSSKTTVRAHSSFARQSSTFDEYSPGTSSLEGQNRTPGVSITSSVGRSRLVLPRLNTDALRTKSKVRSTRRALVSLTRCRMQSTTYSSANVESLLTSCRPSGAVRSAGHRRATVQGRNRGPRARRTRRAPIVQPSPGISSDRSRCAGSLAAKTHPPRVRSRALRAHVPPVAQLARTDDRK